MKNEVIGEKLTHVGIKVSDLTPSGDETLANEITFFFETKKLVITPLIDTDEIHAQFYDSTPVKHNGESLYPHYLGQSIGYLWEATNSNGYFDIFIIGFYLTPTILILSEGSSLQLFDIKQSILFS